MKKIVYDASLTVVLIIAIVFIVNFVFLGRHNSNISQDSEFQNEIMLSEAQNMINGLNLQAKAISIYDSTKNIKLYGNNDNVPLPIASLTKIMTALVALEKYGVNGEISISPEALSKEGDYGLFLGEKWKVGDLIKFTLVASANDGAYALADENLPDFLDNMEIEAKNIGMTTATYLNPTGLDIYDSVTGQPVKAGAYVSANDMNKLAVFAFQKYPDIFGATTLSELTINSESGYTHTISNTNIDVSSIPNLQFSKTGYTLIAGGSLTIIFKNMFGDNIAVTLLGSTIDGRFNDIKKIVNSLYNFNVV